jgi:hypothetical protein
MSVDLRLLRCSVLAGAIAAVASVAMAQSSQNGVRTLSPPGAIKPTGTWDVAARAGDFIYIAGMREASNRSRVPRHGPFPKHSAGPI